MSAYYLPDAEKLAAAHKTLHFFAYLVGAGHHIAAWRHPSANPAAAISFDHYRSLADIAEQGVLDAVFFADSLAVNEQSHHGILDRFDPVGLITALAPVTKNVGLIATASTSYDEPYNLARALLSADRISKGRAGWNIVTTRDLTNTTARNYGRPEHYEHSIRYERAEEFVDVVRGLWRSWEPDAFTYDKVSGQFFDPAKLHRINHRGNLFPRVDGPLNIAPSEQGEPLLVQAGSSEPGIALGARVANAIFTFQPDIPAAQQFRNKIRDKARASGRNPDEVYVLGGISPIVAETEAKAWDLIRELDDLVEEPKILSFLDDYFGHAIDFRQFTQETSVADSGILALPELRKDFWKTHERISGREKSVTLKQLYSHLTGVSFLPDFVGEPEKVADNLIRWFEAGAFDGYILINPLLPRDLSNFVEQVVPILQRRGYSPSSYSHPTLRGRLGLIDG